jgi:hypothetical protein
MLDELGYENKWKYVKEFRKLEEKYFEKFGFFPDCEALM